MSAAIKLRAERDPNCEFGYWRVVEVEAGTPIISLCDEAEAKRYAIALNYHKRLVEALRSELVLSCSGAPARGDGSCGMCGSISCVEHYALLAEIERAEKQS